MYDLSVLPSIRLTAGLDADGGDGTWGAVEPRSCLMVPLHHGIKNTYIRVRVPDRTRGSGGSDCVNPHLASRQAPGNALLASACRCEGRSETKDRRASGNGQLNLD